jgi:large subunit ribosomal protein L20
MRTKNGPAKKRARKRMFKAAKGYVGGRRKLYRTVAETVVRAGAFALRDRRAKKREFRRLWIVRLSAAVAERGLRYSQFIYGLSKTGIELDRKSLSEMAIHDPAGFDAVVEQVKAQLPKQASA